MADISLSYQFLLITPQDLCLFEFTNYFKNKALNMTIRCIDMTQLFRYINDINYFATAH